MITALDHVIVAVRDPAAARADYEKLLGLSASWTGTHPGYGTENVLFRLENTYLELLAPARAGPLSAFLSQWLEERGEGMFGMVFATDDIDRCRDTLDERGLAPGPVEAGHGHDRTSGAERRWRRCMLPVSSTRGLVIFPIQHDSPVDALPLALATGDAAACVHALDHAVVQTTDGDAARKLFGDAFGLRLAVDREFADWGVRLMFFRVGGITVEVAAALAGADVTAALPGATATAGEDRFYGMSYCVRGIEAARERLAREGLDVSEVRTGRRPGTRVFTVRSGTHGVPTLVIEHAPR